MFSKSRNTMRKILLLLCMLSCKSIAAQPKIEVKLGVGLLARPYFREGVIKPGMKGDDYIDGTYSGNYYIELLFNLKSKFKIGIVGITEWSNNTYAPPGFLQRKKRYSDVHTTILGTAQWQYITKANFEAYSALGLGPSLRFRKIQQNDFDDIEASPVLFLGYQITAWGMRFGKKTAGFVELGYGYKGILSAGLSVKL